MNGSDWWTADRRTRQTICLELLVDIRARLAASPPQLEVCCDALLRVGTRLGFTGIGLWLVTAEGTLRNRGFAASADVSMFEENSRHIEFLPGEGLPGRALLHGTIEWLPNVIRDDNFPRLRGAIRDLVRTVVAFPALVGGRPVAVIEMFSREVRERDADTIEFFATLGTDLGSYLAGLS